MWNIIKISKHSQLRPERTAISDEIRLSSGIYSLFSATFDLEPITCMKNIEVYHYKETQSIWPICSINFPQVTILQKKIFHQKLFNMKYALQEQMKSCLIIRIICYLHIQAFIKFYLWLGKNLFDSIRSENKTQAKKNFF